MKHPDMTNLVDTEADPNEGLFMAWILPTAMVAISVTVIWACKFFGILQ
jgi:hypothetical protein